MLGDLRVPVQGDQVRTIVLACPPHELHDLPLELFGAMLHARSWRVVSLGANTPMSAVGEAVRFLEADACVLAGVRRSAFESRVAVARPPGGRACRCSWPARGPSPCRTAPAGVTVLPRDLRVAADLVDAVGAVGVAARAHDRNEPAVG